MSPQYAPHVVVSDQSLRSHDAYDVVRVNVEYVNLLREDAFLRDDEICRDALASYYVDFYRAQMDAGGFAQFVHSSHWKAGVVELVRSGLSAMRAAHQLALLEDGTRKVSAMGQRRLADFLRRPFFGQDNPEREELSAIDSAWEKACAVEDLIALNAAWLRGLPELRVLTVEQMAHQLERIALAVPDRPDRKARALAKG